MSGDDNEFLAPKYSYFDYISTPEDMDMSDEGTYKALSNNIAGIINYSNVLISGRGAAIKNSPSDGLGSKFFINTGAQCKHAVYIGQETIPGTKELRDIWDDMPDDTNLKNRSLYVDNTVKGNILGKKNIGLIPGMLENVTHLNPIELMGAFVEAAQPRCKRVKRSTMPDYGTKIRYVAFNDLPRDEWESDELDANDKERIKAKERDERAALADANANASPEKKEERFQGYNNLINELNNRKRKNIPVLQFIKNKNILEKYPLINVLTSGVSVALLILIYKLMNNTISKK
tara:strand:- start:38 stop:907 length:870 start_codon:yes stop_codon:yes gene_type:complete